MASFFTRLSKAIESSSNTAGQKRDSATDSRRNPDGPHRITIKIYIQCLNAKTNPSFRDMPEAKRLCSDATPLSDTDVPVEEVGTTVIKGTCPVCAAVEEESSRSRSRAEIDEIVTQKLNQTTIVSILFIKTPRY
jgi:hypothetical protein